MEKLIELARAIQAQLPLQDERFSKGRSVFIGSDFELIVDSLSLKSSRYVAGLVGVDQTWTKADGGGATSDDDRPDL